ncbi:MAG: TlpA disulfide reductase family protein [Luteimonas sp.]
MKNTLIAMCLGLLLLAGCKRPDAAAPSATTPPPSAEAPAAPATTPPSQSTAPTEPSADASAPEREVPTLRIATFDGAQYDLAQHRGKWVVVNFWATWCTPCRKEMPELSALDAMRENIDVIGLAYEEIEPAEMKTFLQQHPVVYPIAVVDVSNPPADFATPRGLPMTYLIAPDGKVAKQFLGPVTAREIEAAIASAGSPAAKA